jgi:hypothetical protein
LAVPAYCWIAGFENRRLMSTPSLHAEQLQEGGRAEKASISLEDFIRLARAPVRSGSYHELPQGLEASYRALRRESGRTAALYLRELVQQLAADFRPDESAVRLPPKVRELYQRELFRIRGQLETFDLNFYDFDNDPCVKDYALLTHRFIPVGVEFAVPFSGIPRRTLVQGGFGQFCRAVRAVLRAGGFKPYLSLHAHPLVLSDFNPQGWEASYHLLAELLQLNPDIKGMISASWFLDPRLRSISPHLSYLRDLPERNGCAFFFVEYDTEGTSGALAKSATRKRLFREREYVPAIYMRVWARTDILQWSRMNRHSAGEAIS